MPRPLRRDLPDGVYHVTSRGTGGTMIFVDDDDRAMFVRLFERVIARFGVVCHAFCLLGTHYHLLLETRQPILSDTMQRLNGLYALYYNSLHGRRGHLFESRYSAWVVGDERHLIETLAYIRANPVRAGLCASVSDWPWTWVGETSRVGRALAGVPLQGQTLDVGRAAV